MVTSLQVSRTYEQLVAGLTELHSTGQARQVIALKHVQFLWGRHKPSRSPPRRVFGSCWVLSRDWGPLLSQSEYTRAALLIANKWNVETTAGMSPTVVPVQSWLTRWSHEGAPPGKMKIYDPITLFIVVPSRSPS